MLVLNRNEIEKVVKEKNFYIVRAAKVCDAHAAAEPNPAHMHSMAGT
jgi:hypothetical protein